MILRTILKKLFKHLIYYKQIKMNVLITHINVGLLDDVKTQKDLTFVIVVVDMILLLETIFNIVEVSNINDN